MTARHRGVKHLLLERLIITTAETKGKLLDLEAQQVDTGYGSKMLKKYTVQNIYKLVRCGNRVRNRIIRYSK